MEVQTLLPNLFRTEYRKLVAVLCRHFGLDQIEIAEDIASDTFLTASETWPYKGVPEKPTAWLYVVAKNKARNHLRRQHLFDDKISGEITSSTTTEHQPELDLSQENITDSQLRMLFAVCHPAITQEVQIALALRILCGFGIDEIANAFLTNKETINKRLFRAKEKIRMEKIALEFPETSAIPARLDSVLTMIYLLFNEGYYSESHDAVIREDLCAEAIRLTYLLIENPQTQLPEVNALLALMCFHASRFAARKDNMGEMILYQDQDESLWNIELISKGVEYLHRASQGDKLTRYHLEAGIAYWHTIKSDIREKWENILKLYNQLLQVAYSPTAALNRIYALAKVKGMHEAIIEAEQLQLVDNHYYFTLLGELHKNIDPKKANAHFSKALDLAKTKADKHALYLKLTSLESTSSKT